MTPAPKIMPSLTTFADELEREARQRVTDAMQRKAKAGHVSSVCATTTNLLEVARHEMLDALRRQVLASAVVETAIRRAIGSLSPPQQAAEDVEALRAELRPSESDGRARGGHDEPGWSDPRL